jgi:hypothetical protein
MPHPNVTGRRLAGEEVPPEKRAFTVEEFMAAFGLGRNAGSLTALKLGRKTLIPRDSAEAWLASLPALKTREAAAA